MTVFRWSAQFETGLAEVDAQHQHLVALLEALSGRLEEPGELDTSALAPIHAELLDYARYHFENEEGLMAAAGLDPRHVSYHQREHRDFVEQVLAMVARPSGGEREGPRLLLEFLVHWLTYHILGSDQAMARQVAAVRAGASREQAYAASEHAADAATATLLTSVRALFDALSDRNRALTLLTATLEDRVRQRTEALTAANAELQSLVARVENMAMTDALTGLPNRRYAMDLLARTWAAASRFGRPLTCLVIDADGFKQVNDTGGHDAGDEVLKALAAALRGEVRGSDEVCRIGGDEFLVIAPETALEGGLVLGERLRKRVAALVVPFAGGAWRGSISVGVATRGADTPDPAALLRAADEGVYEAKHAGRNAVRLAPPPAPRRAAR